MKSLINRLNRQVKSKYPTQLLKHYSPSKITKIFHYLIQALEHIKYPRQTSCHHDSVLTLKKQLTPLGHFQNFRFSNSKFPHYMHGVILLKTHQNDFIALLGPSNQKFKKIDHKLNLRKGAWKKHIKISRLDIFQPWALGWTQLDPNDTAHRDLNILKLEILRSQRFASAYVHPIEEGPSMHNRSHLPVKKLMFSPWASFDLQLAIKNKHLSHFDHKLSIMSNILKGLKAIHDFDYVHQDIKPENILLFPDPNSPYPFKAKITDFGLCENTRDRINWATGTIGYESPEVNWIHLNPKSEHFEYFHSKDSAYSMGKFFVNEHRLGKINLFNKIYDQKAPFLAPHKANDIFSCGLTCYFLFNGRLLKPIDLNWPFPLPIIGSMINPLRAYRPNIEQCLAGYRFQLNQIQSPNSFQPMLPVTSSLPFTKPKPLDYNQVFTGSTPLCFIFPTPALQRSNQISQAPNSFQPMLPVTSSLPFTKPKPLDYNQVFTGSTPLCFIFPTPALQSSNQISQAPSGTLNSQNRPHQRY